MKTPSTVLTMLLAMSLAFVAPVQFAAAQQQQDEPRVVSVTEVSATVENIDKDNRILTLKGPEGRTVEVKVSEDVKNFDQIAKGDEISVEYLESIALRLSSEPVPPAEFAKFTEVAPPGEKPAAVSTSTLQMAATIEKVDKKDRAVTVKGPKGNTHTLNVGPEVNLDKIKEGDQIVVTYSQAIATSVKKGS